MSRTISWFSCGAASAVATKMTPEAVPVYCETRAEHPDNERFLADCERWFGRKIERLRNDAYSARGATPLGLRLRHDRHRKCAVRHGY